MCELGVVPDPGHESPGSHLSALKATAQGSGTSGALPQIPAPGYRQPVAREAGRRSATCRRPRPTGRPPGRSREGGIVPARAAVFGLGRVTWWKARRRTVRVGMAVPSVVTDQPRLGWAGPRDQVEATSALRSSQGDGAVLNTPARQCVPGGPVGSSSSLSAIGGEPNRVPPFGACGEDDAGDRPRIPGTVPGRHHPPRTRDGRARPAKIPVAAPWSSPSPGRREGPSPHSPAGTLSQGCRLPGLPGEQGDDGASVRDDLVGGFAGVGLGGRDPGSVARPTVGTCRLTSCRTPHEKRRHAQSWRCGSPCLTVEDPPARNRRQAGASACP